MRERLNEVKLGHELRNKESEINESQFEIKNLDQELVMIKREMALLKC